MKIIKKVLLTLLFPALMFVVMLAITASNAKCYINGQLIFLQADLVRQVLINSSMTVCVALAIWLQLKNGRFDFSAGSNMILSAIVAGNVGLMTNSPWIAMASAVAVSVVLSSFTGAMYIIGRVPIIITTIGCTLFFESLTYLVFGGTGVSAFYSMSNLAIFGRMPGIFLPAGIAILAFVIFVYFTTQGRKGKILSNNQSAGVNIGIDEKKNIMISYLFTGVILGMAAMIYVSQQKVGPQSGLATSGVMFSYIVPVFMGMFIGLASCDVVGIIIAAMGLEILYYGLNCLNLGAGGWQQIIMGLFVMGFYSFSGRIDLVLALLNKLKGKKKTVA